MSTDSKTRARLRQLLRTVALQRGSFVLASGKTSSFYLDCRRVTLDAEGAFLVGTLLFNLLIKGRPAVKGVGGLTMGADPIVTAISTVSHLQKKPLQGFLVRKEQKGHGMAKWLEKAGRLKPGSPVAVVEDVVTSGGSILKAKERAESEGFKVVRAITLVDREEGGLEALSARGLKLECLFSIRDLLDDR